jgi:hypothetical protein
MARVAAGESVTIAGRPERVAVARAFAAAVLGHQHSAGETAVLLVSELVTDSVRHSASGRPGETITVTVLSGGEVTQVQVTDRSVGVVTRGDFGLLSRDVMAVTLRASMLQRMQRGVWVGAAELPGCARLELAPLVDSVKPE